MTYNFRKKLFFCRLLFVQLPLRQNSATNLLCPLSLPSTQFLISICFYFSVASRMKCCPKISLRCLIFLFYFLLLGKSFLSVWALEYMARMHFYPVARRKTDSIQAPHVSLSAYWLKRSRQQRHAPTHLTICYIHLEKMNSEIVNC